MTKLIYHLTTIFIILSFTSCNKTELQIALEKAGSNKPELQKVLDYYLANDADSLKHKAAIFLIENMPYHFSFSQNIYINGKHSDSINWSEYNLEHIFAQDAKHLQLYGKAIDSLKIRIIQGDDILWDINTITADMLIENIEYAFKAWKFPWSKHLSFDEFCEYILPYRCKSEPLSLWRRHFYDQYSGIIDSLPENTTPLEACTFLQEVLKKDIFYSSRFSAFYSGLLPPKMFQNIKVGSCDNTACYSSLVMRALGIPVLYDEILFWPRHNVGHAYNWVETKDSVEGYIFSLTDGPPDISRSPHGATRIMRYTYKIQDNPLWTMWEQDLDVAAPYLISRHQFDVTDKYCDVSTLKTEIKKKQKNNELIWLCTINSNRLNPINFATPQNNDTIYFNKVTNKLLYVLARYNAGVLTPITSPFVTDKGKPDFFSCNSDSLCSYIFKTKLQSTIKKVKIKYWYNTWNSIFVEPQLIKTNSTIGKTNIYKIELKDVPEGTIFYMKDINRWFTFDKKGNQRFF